MIGRTGATGVLLGALVLFGTLAAPVAAQQPAPAAAMEVRIELAVQSFASNARAATAANELAVQRVMRVLAQAGVAPAEIEAHGISVLAEYAPREVIPARTFDRGRPRIAGYLAVSRFALRAQDAAQAALLIDLAEGAGARLLAAHSH